MQAQKLYLFINTQEGVEKLNKTNEGKYIVDHTFIDWPIVEDYLKKHIKEIPDKTMKVKKFTEGYSNLTYLLKAGDWEGILRRPPFGRIPPRAHDMQREFQILEKINPSYPLAPKPYIYCEDYSVMDKHFYVMERKRGNVIDDKLPRSYGESDQVGPKISYAFIEALIELQSLDYKEAGLANFGKPEGYLERQVNGWIKRYSNSKTVSFPYVAELENWLIANRPETKETTIVHNDFKLNNLVFDETNSKKVIGVLDWELSTIGDPLNDIGSAVAYWGEANDPDMGVNIITDQPGFYSRREIIEEYANKSGRDLSNITFYVAFGFYKLAVILQQIYYRWKNGEIQDGRFKSLDEAVCNLFEMANLTRRNQLF